MHLLLKLRFSGRDSSSGSLPLTQEQDAQPFTPRNDLKLAPEKWIFYNLLREILRMALPRSLPCRPPVVLGQLLPAYQRSGENISLMEFTNAWFSSYFFDYLISG